MNEEVINTIVGEQTTHQVSISIKDSMLSSTKIKFNGTREKLSTIGKSIPDDDKVFQLAHALGPMYAHLKMAMLNHSAVVCKESSSFFHHEPRRHRSLILC